MASEERKAADRAIQEQNLHNSLGAGEQQAETDAFQCGRCKQVRIMMLTVTEILGLGANYPIFYSVRPVTDRRRRVVLMNR